MSDDTQRMQDIQNALVAHIETQLTTDEDFSRQCDYRECAYDCYGVPIFDFREELDKIFKKL